MTNFTYILDNNDPEYTDWIFSRQNLLLINDRKEIVYQYDHSEARYHSDGEWVHVLVPIFNKEGRLPITLKSSPGWRPMMNSTYRQNQTIKFGDLPRNEYGHIQLTEFHFNYISSVADEFSRTDYLLAFRVEEDYSELGLQKAYYL